MPRNLETMLCAKLSTLHSTGQISTSTGEEVICTALDRDSRVQLSRLASAFVETDQLARGLKLGSLQKVIISQTSHGATLSTGTAGVPRTDSVVQSKLWGGTTPDERGEESLLTTTVAPTLHNALIGDSIICEATQAVLNRG